MHEAFFLKTIIENPNDPGPRLVYADFLEETGQCERAEFIRIQCELAHRYDESLDQRQKSILRDNYSLLIPECLVALDPKCLLSAPKVEGTRWNSAVHEVWFRRGFVEEIQITWRDWYCERFSVPPLMVATQPIVVDRIESIADQIRSQTPLKKVIFTTQPEIQVRSIQSSVDEELATRSIRCRYWVEVTFEGRRRIFSQEFVAPFESGMSAREFEVAINAREKAATFLPRNAVLETLREKWPGLEFEIINGIHINGRSEGQFSPRNFRPDDILSASVDP